MLQTIKEKYKNAVPDFKKSLSRNNIYALPRITKVVLNVGVGASYDDKRRQDIIKFLSAITGQKPKECPARKSISSFKVREGMIIGYSVTLRGRRMYEFLDRLFLAALPRIRDFQGISPNSLDGNGNLTIGIKEHIVFPELAGEDVKDIKSLEVTIVTNADRRDDAMTLFNFLGLPFSKNYG